MNAAGSAADRGATAARWSPRGVSAARRVLLAAGFVVAAVALWRFPWPATFAALLGANAGLLGVAMAVNLASLLAKGWAWHLLLHPVAGSRWRTAQEANLVGAAVNNLSVSLMGEAARLHHVVSRDGVPAETAAASILAARAVEALGLALFLLVTPFLENLPPALRGIHLGALLLLALAAVALAVRSRGVVDPPRFLPRVARSMLAALAAMGSARRVAAPTLLALLNWIAQWATYHLVLRAVGVAAAPAASCAALIVTNLGGLLRITPANVGVTQAAMTVALLPFGVPPGQAVAAGLALQGIQVVPVLLLATGLVGWKGLRRAAERTQAVRAAACPRPGRPA